MKKILLIGMVIAIFLNIKASAQSMTQLFPVDVIEMKQLEQFFQPSKTIERYNHEGRVTFKMECYIDPSTNDSALYIRTYVCDNTGEYKIDDAVILFKRHGIWLTRNPYMNEEYLPGLIKKSVAFLKNR